MDGQLPTEIVLNCLEDNDYAKDVKRFPVAGGFVDICEALGVGGPDSNEGLPAHSVYSNNLWDGALVAGALLRRQPWLARGRRVLEIGAGLGLPSIVAGALGGRVVATEQLPLHLLTREVSRNRDLVHRSGGSIEVAELDWEWLPEDVLTRFGSFDLILGCDILAGVKPGTRHFCQILRIVGAITSTWGEVLLTWIPRMGRELGQLLACVSEVLPGWSAQLLDESLGDPAFAVIAPSESEEAASGASVLRLCRPQRPVVLEALD